MGAYGHTELTVRKVRRKKMEPRVMFLIRCRRDELEELATALVMRRESLMSLGDRNRAMGLLRKAGKMFAALR